MNFRNVFHNSSGLACEDMKCVVVVVVIIISLVFCLFPVPILCCLSNNLGCYICLFLPRVFLEFLPNFSF
jgi:hypothetical protein